MESAPAAAAAAAADSKAAAELEAEEFRAAKHMAVLGLSICTDGGSRKTAAAAAPPAIGVRRVGELDETLWAEVWKRVFPVQDPSEEPAAAHKRAQMTSIWEDFLVGKQAWSGVVAALENGGGGAGKKNKKFAFLAEELHAAVAASMREVEELVGDAQCFPQLKAWNYRAEREATLAEVVERLAAVLDAMDDALEALFQKVEEQNRIITAERPPGAEDISVKHVSFRAAEEEEGWGEQEEEREREERGGSSGEGEEQERAEHREAGADIMWVAPVCFTEAEGQEFLRKRVERRAGLAGSGAAAAELEAARDAAFQALLKHGSRSAIGVRELGYLGFETQDEVAEYYADILVRYQLVEYPHRVKPAAEGSARFPLPEGYAQELRGMGGLKTFPSREAAARAHQEYKAAKNPCPVCRMREPEGATCLVYYCRDCLAPQAWNYKHQRKAGVAETMAYLVGAILYRQRETAFLKAAVKIQMGGSCDDF